MKDKLEKVLSSSTLLIIITMHNCTNLNHFENHWFIIALDANLPPQPHSRVAIMRKEWLDNCSTISISEKKIIYQER
jgi:hypothetical protein